MLTTLTRHDQLMKAFVQRFLPQIISTLLPNIACQIDFSRIQLLDKELISMRQKFGKLIVDFIARVRLRRVQGTAIIHIEIELVRRARVINKVVRYLLRLLEMFNEPILSLVFYLRSGSGIRIEDAKREAFGVMTMCVKWVGIGFRGLEAKEYAVAGEPVGCALSALMRKPKDVMEALELRAHCVRVIMESEYTEEEKMLLLDVIETYWEMSAREQELFETIWEQIASKEVKEMRLTWSAKLIQQGVEQGMEQGIERGTILGQKRILYRMIREKFGRLPRHIRQRIEAIEEPDVLDELSVKLLTANTLEELGLDESGRGKLKRVQSKRVAKKQR